MTRDEAIVIIHEHVGDDLDGDATLEECIAWCDRDGRANLPREVDVAIMVAMNHIVNE